MEHYHMMHSLGYYGNNVYLIACPGSLYWYVSYLIMCDVVLHLWGIHKISFVKWCFLVCSHVLFTFLFFRFRISLMFQVTLFVFPLIQLFLFSIYLYIVIHFDYVLLIYNSHQHCSKLSTEEYNGLVYFGSQQDTIITKEYLSPVLDNRTRMILHYRQPPLSPLEEFVLENYIDFIPNYKMVQIGEDGYEPNQWRKKIYTYCF